MGNPNCCFMIIAVAFFFAEGNCGLECLNLLLDNNLRSQEAKKIKYEKSKDITYNKSQSWSI